MQELLQFLVDGKGTNAELEMIYYIYVMGLTLFKFFLVFVGLALTVFVWGQIKGFKNISEMVSYYVETDTDKGRN